MDNRESKNLLEISGLSIDYFRGKKIIPALRNASIEINEGESVGLVGESGSGKSTLALAALRLISPHEGRVTQGKIIFEGKDILNLPGRDMRAIRGKDIGIIFQDPFSSLNPVLRIGEQVEEAIEVHEAGNGRSHSSRKTNVLEIFQRVRLPEPERIYNSYPHQVSGGQRQRALIAMAIANSPKLLIADEPTTALDVTVQKEILDLLAQLRKDMGMALILITHHLGIVSQSTERIYVLKSGEVVESGATRIVLSSPAHTYTRELLLAVPQTAKVHRA